MLKFLSCFLLLALTTGSAFANSIETFSLLDTQGERDASILIGASEEQIAKYLPGGKLHSQILAFFVKFKDREILFDTGLRDGHIVKELEKIGISPSDVKIIFLTHLHPDHFGGLVDENGKASFPNAEIYVSKIERDYWVNEVKNENVTKALELYKSKLNLFNFGDKIFEGVQALDASGHTPGHTVFDIKAEGEELLIVGDILHFIEIQLPAPEISNNYDVDPDKARESRIKILDYAAENSIPIAGMHITPPGLMKVKKSGTGYEKF